MAGGAPISLNHGALKEPGVIAHELGHYLFGLMEQYDEQQRFGAGCGIGAGFDPVTGALGAGTWEVCGAWGAGESCQPFGRRRCVLPDAAVTSGYRFVGPGCVTDADCSVAGTVCRETLASEFSTPANHDPIQATGELCPAPQPSVRLGVYGKLDVRAVPSGRDPAGRAVVP